MFPPHTHTHTLFRYSGDVLTPEKTSCNANRGLAAAVSSLAESLLCFILTVSHIFLLLIKNSPACRHRLNYFLPSSSDSDVYDEHTQWRGSIKFEIIRLLEDSSSPGKSCGKIMNPFFNAPQHHRYRSRFSICIFGSVTFKYKQQDVPLG